MWKIHKPHDKNILYGFKMAWESIVCFINFISWTAEADLLWRKYIGLCTPIPCSALTLPETDAT